MKYCPLCERKYDDQVRECEFDGAILRVAGVKQDPYLGKLIKGRYNVLSKIGEGGMGAVYLAEQVSIGRKVALKLLHGNYASDDEFIGRFRREARLAASLNHRNIVTVYDFDQGHDGTLFIAMEYLQGSKLSEVIGDNGPLEIARSVGLGLQIAEGLEAAHRAGVIHRDIKPDNIMVVGNRGEEEIKLMDFGIARMMDTATMANLTRPGMIMGTPAYMAPEQAEGAEVSEKTDIYALGIVLYEMLSGSVPFKASTPSAVLIKQLQETPAPLRKLRREVPSALERIVMQALEKKPGKRLRGMHEIVEELQKLEASLVAEDVPKTIMKTMFFGSGDLEQSSRFKLKGPPLVIGVAALTMLLTTGLLAYWKLGTTKATEDPKKLVSLAIQGEKRELRVGEKTLLRAAGKLSDGSETGVTKNLEWTSSNESVVAVTSDGQVRAHKDGFADITVRSDGLSSAPLTLVVNASSQTLEESTPPISARVQEFIKVASSFRDQGDYTNALAELKKAKALDSNNRAVQSEIQHTQNACLAERRQGTTSASCD